MKDPISLFWNGLIRRGGGRPRKGFRSPTGLDRGPWKRNKRFDVDSTQGGRLRGQEEREHLANSSSRKGARGLSIEGWRKRNKLTGNTAGRVVIHSERKDPPPGVKD